MGAAINRRAKYLCLKYLTKSIDWFFGGRGIACSYHIQGVSTNYAVRYEGDTGGNEKHIGYICGNGKVQWRMVKEKMNIISHSYLRE